MRIKNITIKDRRTCGPQTITNYKIHILKRLLRILVIILYQSI